MMIDLIDLPTEEGGVALFYTACCLTTTTHYWLVFVREQNTKCNECSVETLN